MSSTQTRAAFEEFVAGRWAALSRTAYHLTGHQQDAEDLLQSALAKLAVRWTSVEDPEAYVRRSLYHAAVSSWRRSGRRPEVLTGELPPIEAPTAAEIETRLLLHDALRKLTPKQRAVLVLRYLEDRSEAETAEMLGCRVGTVKSQTRHALSRLRLLNPQLGQLAPRPALVPSGLFDRARRAHAVRRFTTALALAAILALAGVGVTLYQQPLVPADSGDAALPAALIDPSRPLADIRYAPLPKVLALIDSHSDVTSGGMIILVGPGNQYRMLDVSDFPGQLLLSPDGRHIATGDILSPAHEQTRVLDVATGGVRTYDAGLPNSFSQDSGSLVVGHFDGDLSSTDEFGGELRVLDLASGAVTLRATLEPGPQVGQRLDTALSPDGSMLLVKRHGDTMVYDRSGKLWSRALDDSYRIESWTPDGSQAVLSWGSSQLYGFDPRTGKRLGELFGPQMRDTALWGGAGDARTFLGWQDGHPVFRSRSRLVILSDSPVVHPLEVPESDYSQVAVAAVDFTRTASGEPDSGPLLQRFRQQIEVALLLLIVFVPLIAAIRRWRRRP